MFYLKLGIPDPTKHKIAACVLYYVPWIKMNVKLNILN